MAEADISSKQTINIYNRAWTEWVLREQEIVIEAELSGEFQFVARASDSLLQVLGKDGRFLSLTELQLRPDGDMPERLTAYAALARRKYKLPVFVTVINLLSPPKDTHIPVVFHSEFMGQMAHQDFQVIGLWELEAEQVLALNNPALLPFIPLMHGGNSEQMLGRCATLIRKQPSYALEMESILSVFAGYVMDSDLIKRILRWEMLELIQESPLVKDILAERELAGERKAMLKSLYKILSARYKVDLEYCEQLGLQNAEITLIEKLQEVALFAPNLEGFEEKLPS